MKTTATTFTVADYCDMMKRGEVIVNRDYQRSEKIWPSAARSYLIETVVLGYPMPKFLLLQITDLRSKKTFKEIVDGQQRSMAILDFFEDRLRLAQTLETDEIAGRTYSGLDDEFKQRFLAYPLSCDLFIAATTDEVRETFRRINSYTVPLNPEEQRHAEYQGSFKWFIYKLARKYDDGFVQIGMFNQKQLMRMADTKLLTEVCHSLLNGIKTTKKRDLDSVYEANDESFPQEADFGKRISAACDQVLEWIPLHDGPLMRPHISYSLLLALVHMKKTIGVLEALYPSGSARSFDSESAIANLASLGEALDGQAPARLEPFVAACTDRTNVKEQREQRFI